MPVPAYSYGSYNAGPVNPAQQRLIAASSGFGYAPAAPPSTPQPRELSPEGLQYGLQNQWVSPTNMGGAPNVQQPWSQPSGASYNVGANNNARGANPNQAQADAINQMVASGGSPWWATQSGTPSSAQGATQPTQAQAQQKMDVLTGMLGQRGLARSLPTGNQQMLNQIMSGQVQSNNNLPYNVNPKAGSSSAATLAKMRPVQYGTNYRRGK